MPPAKLTDICWWVQLADCSTLNNWQELKQIMVDFQLPADAAMGFSWLGEMPDAISIVGSGVPMEVEDLMLRWRPHIETGEHIILIEMARTDIISRHASIWHILSDTGYWCVSCNDIARYLLDVAGDL